MTDADPNVEQAVQAAVGTAALALRDARNVEITTSDEYHTAGEQLLDIKARLREVEATRKSIVQPIQDGIQRINGLFRPALDALTEAQGILNRGMVTWSTEQNRIQQEKNRKAAELAAAEARRVNARADRAEAKGNTAQAAMLHEQAQAVRAPASAPPERAAGTAMRRTWKAELVSKAELIAAVAAGTVSDQALDVNMTYLHQRARADKGDLRIPGVKAVADDTVVATAQ